MIKFGYHHANMRGKNLYSNGIFVPVLFQRGFHHVHAGVLLKKMIETRKAQEMVNCNQYLLSQHNLNL